MGQTKETIRWHWECLIHKAWVARYMCALAAKIWFGMALPNWLLAMPDREEDFFDIPRDLSWPKRHLMRLCLWAYRFLVGASLIEQAIFHDLSKHSRSESRWFIKENHKLRGLTYGSDEYAATLERIRPGIDEHYRRNDHHPEYHENGIRDMDVSLQLEMVCDWLAATRKHADGNIYRSLYINRKRFKYGEREHRYYLYIAERLLPKRQKRKLRAEFRSFLRSQPRGEQLAYALLEDRPPEKHDVFALAVVNDIGEPIGLYVADDEPLVPLTNDLRVAEKEASLCEKQWGQKFRVMRLSDATHEPN